MSKHEGEKTNSGKKAVIVTGATGLIGGALVRKLLSKDIPVIAFARDGEKVKRIFEGAVESVYWDSSRPDKRGWQEYLSRAGGVVHLAGTPIFAKRWSTGFKTQIVESRILGTRHLVQAILQNKIKPECFICSSAVGIYGSDFNKTADETSPHDEDFLARICIDWEKEAREVEQCGVRCVQVRTGAVLSPVSGALKELLFPFSMGFGGVMGQPDGWINWIHIDDMAEILMTALSNKKVSGPVNAVAPNPVRNNEFARCIAKVMRRPCLLRYPIWLLKLMIGEAGEYVSGGARVEAARLKEIKFPFRFKNLEAALKDLLS